MTEPSEKRDVPDRSPELLSSLGPGSNGTGGVSPSFRLPPRIEDVDRKPSRLHVVSLAVVCLVIVGVVVFLAVR
ncbi:hypothetical protein [Litorihabitans aurantiacus]|uniref:Uncharacterized protein n=1 Tax=Litorihabitans aurantiacus TaxID=1930061 RepID=A0AA37UWJ8_9MICO|nr:hypothetical protein [Litorihabitans aurantiacus]GMA30412.1 hypothetical protein GCM10025875_04040 [Litorihabitans aurantiacus]